MHYADEVGLKEIYGCVCEFRDRFGAENWSPAPLLEKLVKEKLTLGAWAVETVAPD